MIGIAALVIGGLGAAALFGLSVTLDQYECSKCKTVGKSEAVRLFSFPILKGSITITGSLTGQTCDHAWRRWFANSKGLIFNRQNWDGCFGEPSWLEELGKK